MEHPTKSSDERAASLTDEEEAWPDVAKVMALMRLGLSYEASWHLSPLASTRLLMVAQAQGIPPDKRVRWATREDAARAAEELNY